MGVAVMCKTCGARPSVSARRCSTPNGWKTQYGVAATAAGSGGSSSGCNGPGAAARKCRTVAAYARYARTRAERLSGGTMAKLNLALALLADPELLLLDEPYASFDWDTYQKFWTLVGERRQAGRSALIISHFVVDEDRFDRILAITDGRAAPR